MKETRFIAQNKQKWQEAETLLNEPVKDPEKLGSLFIQVVDDLSFSRTYYPNRSVRVYLNKIARQFFSIIAAHKKQKHNSFKLFWLDELPQIILSSKRELVVSLLIFLLSLSIGVFSSANDPQFVNSILGDEYVTMTEANIAKGDPMAVYKKSHQVDMLLGITFNNLMVAFRTYVLGIFLGIGTIGSLLFNGIMVGSFQYYFAERGLLFESAVTIWLHGTLEIASIILAGGAGLVLGKGLIFPGTYSRLQSLQIYGLRSLKLMLGISPIIVLAAIIESFLTRYTDAHLAVRLSLILISATFIIGYFVIYPWIKSRTGFQVPLKEIRLPASNDEPVNFTRIKNNADILKDTFQFYARNSTRFLPLVFVVSVGLSAIMMFFEEETFTPQEPEWWVVLFDGMLTALHSPSLPFVLVNGLATALILYRVIALIDSASKKRSYVFDSKAFIQTLAITTLLQTAIYSGWLGFVFAACSFALFIFVAFIQAHEESNLAHSLGVGWELFGKNNNQGITLQLIVLLLSSASLLLVSGPLLYLHLNILQWNFVASDHISQQVIRFIEIFIRIFSFYLILPVTTASLAYLYFSQEEVVSAKNLQASIAKMATRLRKTNTP